MKNIHKQLKVYKTWRLAPVLQRHYHTPPPEALLTHGHRSCRQSWLPLLTVLALVTIYPFLFVKSSLTAFPSSAPRLLL